MSLPLEALELRDWAARHRSLPSVRDHHEPWTDSDEDYLERYLRPLLRLLDAWARHGTAVHSEVYLDERLRFLPVGRDVAQARDDVRQMVAGDEAAILAAASPDRRPDLAALLTELHAPLVAAGAAPTTGLVLVGDCLMTEMRASLTARARHDGAELDVSHVYFSVAEGVELSTSSVLNLLESRDTALVGLSFLTFSGIPPYIALLERAGQLSLDETTRQVDAVVGVIRGYVDQIREHSDVPLLLHGACGLPLDRWRKRLPFLPALGPARRRVVRLLSDRIKELAAATDNVIFLDEEKILDAAGHRRTSRPLLDRSITRGALFHTSGVGRELARHYDEVLRARQRLRGIKVVLVDFDHTLWRGVMAEGPVEHHLEAQRLLRQLKDAGILLVAVSKNDPSSIRWEEMALDRDDFVLLQIGWQPKPDSVREAAARLDLGLSSFVLLDDNPVERAMVTETHPEVRSLDPDDPWTWRALWWLLDFPETKRTEEAARRTSMYREAVARSEVLEGPQDYSALLGRLGLQVEVRTASDKELTRVSELVARTNQFNTTTRRRSRSELRALVEDPEHVVLTYSLQDRFGDLGVVGVTISELRGGETVVDSVVMSCRAMGFGLERLMVREAMEAGGGRGRPSVGLFEPTGRNQPAADLFEQCGFGSDGEGRWRWRPGDALPEVPPWLRVDRTVATA